MENFDDFMYHLVKTEYQTTGFNANFGGGYSYNTDGEYPPLRKFTLTFKGYKYYIKADNTLDKEKNASINNLGRLEDFFLRHLTHKNFEYTHPVYGKKTVRFGKPLIIPEGLSGGGGAVPSFEVTLQEVFA